MRRQEGPLVKPAIFGEFGESGKNGKLVKIANNNLEVNAKEKIWRILLHLKLLFYRLM